MSAESNKAVFRRWLDGWATRSMTVMDALLDETFTADFVVHDKDQPAAAIGREGVKQFVRDAFRNTPDIVVAVEDMIAEGDRVVIRLTVSGTDASTGKPTHQLVIEICRFVEGKIAEQWSLDVPATVSATTAGETQDPVAVVTAFDAACNAGDIERVMAFFTDDAIIKDPADARLHTGRQQIRAWFAPQMGHFTVTSTNRRVIGSTVAWDSILTGDMIKDMGRNFLAETAEAVVQGGKIALFTPTIVERVASQ